MKMAAFGDEETSQSEAPTEEIKVLCYACSSVLNDESFMLPGEESEVCVRMSKSLINLLSSPSQCCLQFANWLIHELQNILEKSKIKNGLFNQETLWSTFHQKTLSSSFEEKWGKYFISVA